MSDHRPVAVVTGASAGIGRSTSCLLVAQGWRVIGTGRDPDRASAAIAEIAAAGRNGGSFTMVRGDFDAMAQVRRVAAEIGALTPRLDVLINNAGGVRDRVIVTPEGNEATFAANHLAPFLLTRELLPLLRATAAVRPAGTVRVIAVSSSGHRMCDPIDFDDLQSILSGDPSTCYRRAKLANILFTRELVHRVSADGIVAQAMDPGTVHSNFASHGNAELQKRLAAMPSLPPEEAARTLAWLATDPAAGMPGGRYFHAMAEEIPDPKALDPVAAARLWLESEALLECLGHGVGLA